MIINFGYMIEDHNFNNMDTQKHIKERKSFFTLNHFQFEYFK